jgi:hypothetical protein
MFAPITRRHLLALASAPLLPAAPSGVPDRHATVSRHDPVYRAADIHAPLQVGNGEFAFSADITGLQSFPALYAPYTPLCTQSQWGWHSYPKPPELGRAELELEPFETHGRKVGYPTRAKGQEALFGWLRENPHRLNLVRIGLIFDGRPIAPDAIREPHQRLDLWSGILESRFRLEGATVVVRTACHPKLDAVAVTVESLLAADGRLGVLFEFPYGSHGIDASDWKSPERHRTTVERTLPGRLELRRTLDGNQHFVRIGYTGNSLKRTAPHTLVLTGTESPLGFVAHFSPKPSAAELPTARRVEADSARHWSIFWTTGGAIDFSAATDRRAPELERRVVLSQYLTAIQCAGSLPPQETGLVCNSWYGKFHLEMHWWHAAHFAQWGRTQLLERSLGWYTATLPRAQETARRQGYAGARWPKMVGPEGIDSPSGIGPLLIWQQPHPIVYAELCYHAHPDAATLERWAPVVLATAEFMASYPVLEAGRYVLGPPVIPAQENHRPRETWNPTFELVYWRQALALAQQWRQRLKMKPEPKWEAIRAGLAKLPVKDGLYLAHENCPQTFTQRNHDHPSMLAALGVLNGEGVDRETMRRTLKKVLGSWRWEETWGWDYPMTAMTAARLNEPDLAMDALFLDSPKNRWLANGHNWQRDSLTVYLPGNGGLLAAVAMMAAGWQGAQAAAAPGFPESEWRIRHQGLVPLL